MPPIILHSLMVVYNKYLFYWTAIAKTMLTMPSKYDILDVERHVFKAALSLSLTLYMLFPTNKTFSGWVTCTLVLARFVEQLGCLDICERLSKFLPLLP